MEGARARPGAGLTALTRIVDRLDRLQRRHGVLGFAYAVVRKFLDDGGAREAALITYYGFLSLFPVLLLGVTVVSWVLAHQPELRHRLVAEIVPPALQSTVENAAAAMPTSPVALVAGLIGLVFSGIGVVNSAYWTVNHVAAVPYRRRFPIVVRYLRLLAVLLLVLAGTVAVGALTIVVTALPGVPQVWRAVSVLGAFLIVVGVLLLAVRLLLARPARVGSVMPGAALGGAAVTAVLQVGAAELPGLVRRSGAVYGSFATVAGIFTLLYLLSVTLVSAAEIAAVRAARLWPRALDPRRPTEADARALALRGREQERTPAERIDTRICP